MGATGLNFAVRGSLSLDGDERVKLEPRGSE
jgi:hypothetical protein